MTENIEQQDAIVKLSNELNAVFENAAILLMLVNNEGRIVHINRSGVELIGESKDNILGLLGGEVFNCVNAWHDGQVVCGRNKDCSNCSVRTLVTDTFTNRKSHYKVEGFLNITYHDQIFRLDILISTSIIESNDNEYVLITIDDISKLKQQERELEQLNRDKDRFMQLLAHDLRTPFNTLLGFSELLKENLRIYNLDTIEHQFSIIHRTLINTYNLLEDLLLWSNAQSGKLAFQPKRLILHDICNNVHDSVNMTAQVKNISIQYFANENLEIIADDNMLKTIFRNLITNAIKYSYHDGVIKCTTEVIQDKVRITISDDGVGIEEDRIPNIFDDTQIVSTEGTDNEKGTGLGLLLCKEFVKKHNGRIWVESEVGKGSDFKVELPLGF